VTECVNGVRQPLWPSVAGVLKNTHDTGLRKLVGAASAANVASQAALLNRQ